MEENKGQEYESNDVSNRHMTVIEKGMMDSGLMTDPACAAPQDGAEFGEQPKGRRKLGPNVEPKR